MKCDSCGAPVENGKCTYCGKEFAQPQSSLQTPPAQPNGGSYYRQTPNFGQGGYVPRPPVQQAPPKKKQSFWSKTGTVVFMLIFFPLIGVCLMWGYKKFNLAARIVVSAVIVFVHIGIFAGGSAASSSEAENAASSSVSSSVSAEEQEKLQGQIGNYICTVKSAEKCKDWNGENAVKITYSFTNNSSDAESFDLALQDEAYQNGVELESTFTEDDLDDMGLEAKVKPDSSKEVSKVYALRDDSADVEIEISEFASFGSDKLNYTVELD